MPFRPILPARAGYVEVENDNGEHVYRRILMPQDAELQYFRDLTADYDAMLVDLIYRTVLLELGVM